MLRGTEGVGEKLCGEWAQNGRGDPLSFCLGHFSAREWLGVEIWNAKGGVANLNFLLVIFCTIVLWC